MTRQKDGKFKFFAAQINITPINETWASECYGDEHLKGAAYHRVSASARSLKRWIFPVAVFGSSRRNSTQRGYL